MPNGKQAGWKQNCYEWCPAPLLFLMPAVAIVFGLVLFEPTMPLDCDEGFMLSTCFASILFVISMVLLRVTRLEMGAVGFLALLYALKVVLSLLYYDFAYLPALGISDEAMLGGTDFTADVFRIYDAAVLFDDYREKYGVYHAIFGDYYRQINNPGVGVYFGLLFGAFGRFPRVAIPWNCLAMTWAMLLIGALGSLLRVDRRATKLAMRLTFFMPSFFAYVPLYRDQLMIYLILLCAYSLLYAVRRRCMLSLVSGFAVGYPLMVLRGAFVLAPVWSLCSILMDRVIPRTRGWLLCVLLANVAISNAVGPLLVSWDEAQQVSGQVGQDAGGGVIGTVIGTLGPLSSLGRLAFMLLTPMPWYQDVEVALLVTQVFDYIQTLLSLTAIVAVVRDTTVVSSPKGIAAPIYMFLMYTLAVLGGSTMAQRYIQIALPLLILPAAPQLLRDWPRCLYSAVIIVIVAHLLLEAARLVVA